MWVLGFATLLPNTHLRTASLTSVTSRPSAAPCHQLCGGMACSPAKDATTWQKHSQPRGFDVWVRCLPGE
jgi:hypothetical protein